MKIVTNKEMRMLENMCIQHGLSPEDLLNNAGLRVAEKCTELFPDISKATVLVLVGSGNNGGDGLIAAKHLHNWGNTVVIYCCLPRRDGDQELNEALSIGIPIYDVSKDPDMSSLYAAISSASLVVDSVLGSGNNRLMDDNLKKIFEVVRIEKASRPEITILSLDLPSGLLGDDGQVDPCSPCADYTLTIGYPKTSLFEFPAAGHVGKLEILNIGIPEELTDDISTDLMTRNWIRDLLPLRAMDSHKGSFGRVLIIAGSERYLGAASLACTAAARSGAGLVTLAIPRNLQHMVSNQLLETTYLPLPEENGVLLPEAYELILNEAPMYQVMLIGCGLGQTQDVSQLIRQTLFTEHFPNIPVVLDADAINLLSKIPEWWNQLRGDAILTPHLGEMSRLTGKSTEQIKSSRLRITADNARHWNQCVVLKGPHTVIAAPDGKQRISPFKNPGLASAGTGDVLAGVTAGLISQGLSTFDAASCAVYIHGISGEMVRHELGDTGMMASDILLTIPKAIKKVKEELSGI